MIDLDPAPFADDPVDVAVGHGLRRRDDRIDVEDLAAAEGHALAGLAEDEAVAGDERETDREMHPDGAGGAGLDRIRAEHPHPDGVLTRTEVEQVGAAAGDRSVE